jgi:hypothetical protein
MTVNSRILSAILGWTILAAIQLAAAEKWGDLKGKFVYDGQPPAPAKIEVNRDLDAFGALNLTDGTLLVSKGWRNRQCGRLRALNGRQDKRRRSQRSPRIKEDGQHG